MRSKRLFVYLLLILIVCFSFNYVMQLIKSENVITNSLKLNHPNIITAYSLQLQPQTTVCKTQKPEKVLLNNQVWQKINNQTVFLYSAYYDARYVLNDKNYHFVRLIASVNGDLNKKHLTCYLWSEILLSPTTVPAVSKKLWLDTWDKRTFNNLYDTYLISCPIPEKLKNKISGVSLSDHDCQSPTNYFTIKESNLSKDNLEDFAVCVKGMDFQEDISLKLVEWIEMQLLLGANRLTFYIYHIHPNIEKVLSFYKNKGLVDTFQVSLPGEGPNIPLERTQYLKDNVWQKRRLELVPYNDCFYRNLDKHRFVVLLDIDEVILPVMHDTWKELLDDVLGYDPKAIHKYSSFSAQNTYFFDSFINDKKDELKGIPIYMNILRHIERSANFSKPGFAVKSFISMNTTLAVFNHYALYPLYPHMHRFAVISTSVAQLNHYRTKCPDGMLIECKNNFAKHKRRDSLVLKYKSKLIANVNQAIHKIGLLA